MKKKISLKQNNIYKTVAPCRTNSSTVTVLSSIKNISVGLLDLVRLKTEPHKNTDEQSDAHVSRSWLIY